MRAVAYCRVSTNKVEQLDSLESQQKFFAEYAAQNAYDLVNIYADEGKSGTKIKNRTQLLKLLADAGKDNYDVVLIKDISRLARNTVDFLTSIRKLKALNIRVVFVNYDQTSSDSSEFMLTMLSAIAQEESANTSKRVRFGKRQNAEHGRVPNLVFGYDKIPGDYFHLIINEEEAAVVKRIFILYTEKNMGANRIASMLNREGIKTKRECNWSQIGVCRILSNEIYAGKIINGKQEIEDFLTGKRKIRDEKEWMIVDNTDLKIISEPVFLKAQEIRKNRVKAYPKETGSTKHRLSQLLRCGNCGSAYRRLVRTYKNTYITWVCNGRNSNGKQYCCNTTVIDEGMLLDSICVFFISILQNNPVIVQHTIKEYNKKLKSNNDNRIKEKVHMAYLSRIIKEKQKYMDMYTNDIITMAELKENTDRINPQIDQYQHELVKIKETEKINHVYNDTELYQYLKNSLKNAGITNSILENLINRIEVDINGNIEVYLSEYTNLTGYTSI